MSENWRRLSMAHNAWLDADAAGRRRLRDEIAATAPDLLDDLDALAAATEAAPGFLDTPAIVLTAHAIARDSAALPPGTTVGPYRLAHVVGRGGMGIVYRATDTRLGRDVAVKMLAPVERPDELRVDRFLHEARLTAAIDHPNVVKVFDVGTHDGQPFMVIELLEGETLRARLDRGPAAEPEARRIATAIACGLSAAHAAGLMHRDLKPENVFLTRAGVTKILDFGIAKLAPERMGPRPGASTLTGVLLGTVGYLAPEQIGGDSVDGRADLFALGAILFELVTGTRAFAGENTVDTLHAILHAPPPDPRGRDGCAISAALASIVRRLLEKSPADRFQSAADLVWALEQTGDGRGDARAPAAIAAPVRTQSTAPKWIAVAAAAALLLAAGIWLGRQSTPSTEPALSRFTWTLPSGTDLWSAPAISPDEQRIAWAARDGNGIPRLFVRDRSAAEAIELAGTEGARQPFWSPDGRWIGFFARGKLKKIPAAGGGPPTDLADAPDAKGAAWSAAGVIVFQPTYRDAALLRVSERGGRVEPATVLDDLHVEVGHKWPAFLPDGRHFLFHVSSPHDDRRGVYVASLDGPATKPGAPLFLSDVAAIYAPLPGEPTGVLLTAAGSRVDVRPFDPVRRTIAGDARAVELPAAPGTPHHASLIAASANLLAFASGTIPWGYRFARVDRDGGQLQIRSGPELGGFPRLSPDGRFLARARVDPVRANPDIWIEDLVRGTEWRVTTSADHDVVPVWSPNGREVAFRSGSLDAPAIAFAAADGSGVRRTLPCPVSPCEPNDWTRDERSLVVTVRAADIWLVPLDGSSATPLLQEPFVQRDARLSPDGRWLAYVSDESGRPEVSVRSLTGAPRRVVVSSGGGDQPVWRLDGAELVFAGPGGQLFAVTVQEKGGSLSFGPAVKLGVPPLGERHSGTTYELTLDGRQVFFPHVADARAPTAIELVFGWQALLR